MRAVNIDEGGDGVFGVFNLCDRWSAAIAVRVGCKESTLLVYLRLGIVSK